MNYGLRVTKNTVSLIARELLNKGTLFILFILVGRLLGKEFLGRYSLAIAISQIFFLGTEFGLNTLMVREVSKERSLAGKFLINIGIFRVISGLFTMGLIWLAVIVIHAKAETAAVIYLCGLSYFFVNITNLYASIFRAFEKMELELTVSLVKNAVFLPLAVIAIFKNFGLIAVFNIFLASNLIALAVSVLIFKKRIAAPSDLKLDFHFLKEQLIQTSPLWLSQLFGIAYLKIAPILLFRLKGEAAVGLYNAGLVVVDAFWVMTGCFVCSIFPIIARSGEIEAGKEYLRGFKFIFCVFAVVAGIIFLNAKGLVLLLYGEKFIEMAPLLKTLALVSLLVALDTHNGMTLIAIRKQFILPFINAAALAINFLLNLFLAARFGYNGSAYALMASELFVFVFMMALLKKFLFRTAKN